MPATVALREAISSFCSKLSCTKKKLKVQFLFIPKKTFKDKPVQSYINPDA